MTDVIEEKMYLHTKIIFFLGIIIFSSYIISFVLDLSKPNANNEEFAFFIMYMLVGIPVLIGWGVVFLRSAVVLTADNDILIVRLVLHKPIIIPLKNIKKIDTWGDVKGGRHFYIVKSNQKNFNTSLISARFGKKNLDIFMEELQLRVDKAKQVK